MKQEIEYAVREANSMGLTIEQSIEFVMRSTTCTRTQAQQALSKYQQRVVMAH